MPSVPKTAPPHGTVTLLDEEAGTQMLSFFSTTVVLLLGTAVSLAYLFDAISSLPLRPATLICALALATLIGIRKGHARIAGQILIWGSWAIILASAPFGSGNRVPARFVWTRFCNSGCLSHGISLTGFMG